MDLNIPDLNSPATGGGKVEVTDRAFERLAEIADASGQPQALRVAVLGGGCSGFSYEFALEEDTGDGDTVIERNGHRVLIDPHPNADCGPLDPQQTPRLLLLTIFSVGLPRHRVAISVSERSLPCTKAIWSLLGGF